MSITIRDVARHAGVSVSTVSRVMNDSSPVHADKRRLVLEAAETLGYMPNPAARSLLGKRTGGLGVLLPFVSGEFFSALLNGLDQAAQDNGFFLVVSTSHSKPAEFRKAVQVLNKRVDGLVVMAPNMDSDDAASIVKTEMPVVFVNTYAEGLAADVINFDNYEGARDLTRHLIGEGHRHIALVKGPPQAGDAHERARGYRDAMAEARLSTAGLEFNGGFSREAGIRATEAVLAAPTRPTAIVAANDYCALGIVNALRQAGVSVPEEVSVGGFDGLPSTAYTDPPLTTVEVPMNEIGYRAITRLVARLNDRLEAHRTEVFPVRLVVRNSIVAGQYTG
ncbi:MAG: LacI family DNA-binding transcriptional regulator [Bacteroidota bacterium]